MSFAVWHVGRCDEGNLWQVTRDCLNDAGGGHPPAPGHAKPYSPEARACHREVVAMTYRTLRLASPTRAR